MRNIALLVLLAILAPASYGQFVLDNRIWDGIDSLGGVVARDQTWSPTLEKMEVIWREVWEDQVPTVEVRLRPNQYFDIFIDEQGFRFKLLNVTGLGNLRKSNYQVTWNSYVWNAKTGTNRLYFRTIGTVFPVNLQNGGAVSEERSFQATIRDVSKYFCNDTVYVTLKTYDAEVANEGQLVVNGNTLNLFGSQAVPANDQQIVDIVLPTPKSWWVDGTNNLKLVHTSTNGFKVDTMFIDSRATWFKKDTVYVLDSLSLPYTNFGWADMCGNIKTPSDSLHVGKIASYYFKWPKYAPVICPEYMVVIDTVSERLQIFPVTIGGVGSTTMVYLRVKHSEIPNLFPEANVPVATLPTRRITGG